MAVVIVLVVVWVTVLLIGVARILRVPEHESQGLTATRHLYEMAFLDAELRRARHGGCCCSQRCGEERVHRRHVPGG